MNLTCVWPKHRRDHAGVPVAHWCTKCARGVCSVCCPDDTKTCHEYPECGHDMADGWGGRRGEGGKRPSLGEGNAVGAKWRG